MSKKIAIGGDHAGFEYKQEVVKHLQEKGYEVKDYGPFSADSCDYPDYVHPLAQSIEGNENELGILICGSGNGVALTANKYAGVRAALVWEKELAELARQHNNANVIALPARFISLDSAIEYVDAFLTTEFEGGRHERRVEKIAPQTVSK